MPNKLNYASEIGKVTYQRPSRVTDVDLNLFADGHRQILFGTTNNDVVEIWVYNPDGSFAGHLNLGPTDEALALVTLVDNTGPYEVLNIDMKQVAQTLGIQPGRYAFVANLFRDEVGSETGHKLYISDISDDRTILTLTPVEQSSELARQMYEFVVPSVPKLFANGLIDEMFGRSLDFRSDEIITIEGILAQMPDVLGKLQYAGVYGIFASLLQTILNRVYIGVIDLMAADVMNLNIQQAELEQYVEKAMDLVIYDMTQRGEVDPRLSLI
jgi:hypothetical protein